MLPSEAQTPDNIGSCKMEYSRPTGDDLTCYSNADQWPKKKWAWEFLRRNQEFIDACEELEKKPSPEKTKAIAKVFSLSQFKDYREEYESPNGAPLRFKPATIQSRFRLKNSDPKEYKRHMNIGDLVVVLNLKTALARSSSIAAQLRAVKNAVERKLKKLAKRKGVDIRDVRVKNNPGQWLNYLRILDYKAAGRKNKDIAAELYPEALKRKLRTTVTKRPLDDVATSPESKKEIFDQEPDGAIYTELLKNQLRRARQIAREDYLNFAVWQEAAPRGKSKTADSPATSGG